MIARRLCLAPWAAAAAAGGYERHRSYVGADFFSKWDFDSSPDPTSGHVIYVDSSEALSTGLANATGDRVYLGADMTSDTGGAGRRSVRVRSKDTFDSGLFIASIDHVPTGCSTWPAFWMYGEDANHPWPSLGEYDVIEGVNNQVRASTTLHTSDGCDQAEVRAGEDMTGGWAPGSPNARASNCYVHAPGQFNNQGCIQEGPVDSIGPGFNQMGGGTYAAEWAPQRGYFRTWFWPRGREPGDIAQGAPTPEAWGTPYSFFGLGLNCPKEHFARMQLMFDLSFCGDWAGGTFARDCPRFAERMTCEELVAFHPEELQEAYWSIRALDVYQLSEDDAVAEDDSGPRGGGGISWWHFVISMLIVLQSVVICGIALFVYRMMRPKHHLPDVERASESSPPSSPTRPLVLGPASPQHGRPAVPPMPPIRMQAGRDQAARSVPLSRAQSAPQRVGPSFSLARP
ncbi:unnamed protein product [Prorocentrum cordatum]|uniref:GH16 domain-containing protein n=1 Tax=Prorocentrum cordatum TaxID=2364126 RepID=A0ABN9QRS7_9DINO|nr:unnamed protein product [Polarella glacialis]